MNVGERAARERVEAVYAAVDLLTPDDLQALTVPLRDPESRDGLLVELEGLADRYGRGALLDEARGRLHEALSARAVARVYTEAGMGRLPSTGRIEDQAQAILALEDAVSVAVAEDILRPADAAALADPGRRLLGLERLEGSPEGSPEDEGPAVAAWEPSAEDWVTAAGPSAVAPDEPMPGVHRMRVAFFAVCALTGAPAAILYGAANDALPMGVLGAVAVLALCWTFATYRSARG